MKVSEIPTPHICEHTTSSEHIEWICKEVEGGWRLILVYDPWSCDGKHQVKELLQLCQVLETMDQVERIGEDICINGEIDRKLWTECQDVAQMNLF